MQALPTRTSLLLGLLLALGACKSSGNSAQPTAENAHARISNEIVATAKVTAIETSARKISLRREDGSQFQILAGEGVRNFNQIAVGDTLRVKYQETLEATRLAPNEQGAQPGVALAAARAKPGEKPAGGVGFATSVCATIQSIDREAETVYFSLPNGERFARHVVTKEGREFVKGLKPGDNVQLDYTEVLALSIEKL